MPIFVCCTYPPPQATSSSPLPRAMSLPNDQQWVHLIRQFWEGLKNGNPKLGLTECCALLSFLGGSIFGYVLVGISSAALTLWRCQYDLGGPQALPPPCPFLLLPPTKYPRVWRRGNGNRCSVNSGTASVSGGHRNEAHLHGF